MISDDSLSQDCSLYDHWTARTAQSHLAAWADCYEQSDLFAGLLDLPVSAHLKNVYRAESKILVFHATVHGPLRRALLQRWHQIAEIWGCNSELL